MGSTETQRLYLEIKNAANMGIRAIDDMLRRCTDEFFRLELMHVQNEYKSIAAEAGMADAPESDGSRMLSRMESGFISEYIGDARGDGTYARADAAASRLADRLLEAQRRHRAIYQRYLT